jgi:hypothetical protein
MGICSDSVSLSDEFGQRVSSQQIIDKLASNKFVEAANLKVFT